MIKVRIEVKIVVIAFSVFILSLALIFFQKRLFYSANKSDVHYCDQPTESDLNYASFEFKPKLEFKENSVVICYLHLTEYLKNNSIKYSKIKIYRNGELYEEDSDNKEYFVDTEVTNERMFDYVIEFIDENDGVVITSEPNTTSVPYQSNLSVVIDASVYDWVNHSKFDEKVKNMLKTQIAGVLQHLSYVPMTKELLFSNIHSVVLEYKPNESRVIIRDTEGREFIQTSLSGPYVWIKFSAAFNQHSFLWDESVISWYFASIFPDLSRSTLDFWYALQIKNGINAGLIPREIRTSSAYLAMEDTSILESNINPVSYIPLSSLQVNNPFLLSRVELSLNSRQSDISRLSASYPKLQSYFQWVENNRKQIDSKTGCPYYKFSNLGSGMDNSMRGYGIFNPSLSEYSWVDLFAQQVFLYQDLQIINRTIAGDDPEAEPSSLVDEFIRCNQDPKDGIFRDRDFATGDYISNPESAAFVWSLLVNMPNQKLYEQMIEVIKDDTAFGGYPPLPFIARNDPLFHPEGNYWQGGVWPPLLWIAIQGLDGIDTGLQQEITQSTMRMIGDVFDSKGTVFEYYSPTSINNLAVPGGSSFNSYNARSDFYGWGSIAIPLYYEQQQAR